jgi:hypothetical protein
VVWASVCQARAQDALDLHIGVRDGAAVALCLDGERRTAELAQRELVSLVGQVQRRAQRQQPVLKGPVLGVSPTRLALGVRLIVAQLDCFAGGTKGS